MAPLKVRENRLRRMAERQMLKLEKSRRRDQRASDYGNYRLVDDGNTVVIGAATFDFDATLDDIETYLTDDTRPKWRKDKDGKFRWHISPARERHNA
jgi:hypothetical protein